jgi:hypothetical protein
MLAAGLPAMAAAVLFTNPGSRRIAFAQLRYPALAMGGFIASFYLLTAVFDLPMLFKSPGSAAIGDRRTGRGSVAGAVLPACRLPDLDRPVPHG